MAYYERHRGSDQMMKRGAYRTYHWWKMKKLCGKLKKGGA